MAADCIPDSHFFGMQVKEGVKAVPGDYFPILVPLTFS